VVPLRVRLHLLEGLIRGFGEGLVEALACLQHLLGLDADVRRLPSHASLGLVNEEAGVGQAEAILTRNGQVDVSAGACHPAGPHHLHPWLHEADHVVEGIGGLHVTALGVDEDGDVVVAVRGQGEELGGDLLGELRGDLPDDQDGAGVEKTLGDLRVKQMASGAGFFLGGHGISSARAVRVDVQPYDGSPDRVKAGASPLAGSKNGDAVHEDQLAGAAAGVRPGE